MGKHEILLCSALFEKKIEILFSYKICTNIYIYILIFCFFGSTFQDKPLTLLLLYIYLWFNVSRLFLLKKILCKTLFFLVQCFKINLLHFYSFIYSLRPSCHFISNTFQKKIMSFIFNLSMTPTYLLLGPK